MITYNWLYIECANRSHLGESGILLCLVSCGKNCFTLIAFSCLSSLCLQALKCLVKINGLVVFYYHFYYHPMYYCKLKLKNLRDLNELRILTNLDFVKFRINWYTVNSLSVDEIASFIGLFSVSMFCSVFAGISRESVALGTKLFIELVRISSLSCKGLSVSLFCIFTPKFPYNDNHKPEFTVSDVDFKLGRMQICLQILSNPNNPNSHSSCLNLVHVAINRVIFLKEINDKNFNCRGRCEDVLEVVVSVTSQPGVVYTKVCENCSNCNFCHYCKRYTLRMSNGNFKVAKLSPVIGLKVSVYGKHKYLHRIEAAFYFSCPDVSRLSKCILEYDWCTRIRTDLVLEQSWTGTR
jgi:hypothetical protein